MLRVVLISLLLLDAAWAQEAPKADNGYLEQAVQSLQQQRNAAMDSAAGLSAQLQLLQRDYRKLQTDFELYRRGHPDAPDAKDH